MRIIEDYGLSRAILVSEAFGTYSLADQYRRLQSRLGHGFQQTIELCEMLPIFMDGEAHQSRRRLIARQLSKCRESQLAAADAFLCRFREHTVLPGRTVELLSQFAEPLFREIAGTILGKCSAAIEWVQLAEDVPLLFSSLTPLKKRIEIDRRLGDLFSQGEIDPNDFAALTLGVKPLTGSLALSLHAVFAKHPQGRTADMAWPDAIPESALLYVDRVALHRVTLGEHTFAAGERARCLIRADAWTEGERHATMFGAGSHLCLGRPLSERLWQMTAACFATCELQVETAPVSIRRDSEPFDLPERCDVRFLAG